MRNIKILFGLFFALTFQHAQSQTPADAALCFYQWYLDAIKGPAEAHTAIVKKGPAGETLLVYSQYLKNLDSLGCVSDTFIQSEKQRFAACQDYFQATPYSDYYEYIDNDPFFFDRPCPFFTRFHWVDGLAFWKLSRVTPIDQTGDRATVMVELSNGPRTLKKTLQLTQEEKVWKIVAIQ